MPPHLVPQCRINPRLCSPSYRPPEIEATVNGWSVRELERQISSSLYERLALSRDKANVLRLAREGHVVEKAADLIKNPLVLEFLGLEQKPAYSEARQKRFTFDNKHFFVDLVFYGSSGNRVDRGVSGRHRRGRDQDRRGESRWRCGSACGYESRALSISASARPR